MQNRVWVEIFYVVERNIKMKLHENDWSVAEATFGLRQQLLRTLAGNSMGLRILCSETKQDRYPGESDSDFVLTLTIYDVLCNAVEQNMGERRQE